MDLQFYGANCLVASDKGVRLVIDDNLVSLGSKSITKDGDIALQTLPDLKLANKVEPKLTINGPGEYEVSGVSVYGIAARSHMDEPGETSATMYKLVHNGLSLLFTGHIYPELAENQLDQIGEIDALIIPVGGSGYTLDAIGALKLVKDIEPKLVIPTHYDDKSFKYEMPQATLEQAIKELGMEPKETTGKLKLKPGELSDVTQLVILEKS